MEHRGKSNIYYVSFLIIFILVLVGGMFLKGGKGVGKNSTSIYYNIIRSNIPVFNKLGLDANRNCMAIDIETLFYRVLQLEIPVLNNNVESVQENIISIKPFNIEVGAFKKGSTSKVSEVAEAVSVFDSSLVFAGEVRPKVLIYHTHTHEGYEKTENYDDNTVVQAGISLKSELEKYGVEVIHDTTVNDIPYETCYAQSGKILEKNLQENESFDLIIDLHRDSIEDKEVVTTNINKVDMASFFLVFAKNSEKYNENIELGNKIEKIAKSLYPSIMRDHLQYNKAITNNAFNLGKDSKLMLIELGAVSNTIDEAVESTKYIARIIAEYMKEEVNP